MQESVNRGLRLGMVLLGLFTISAVVVYIVAGAAGSEGTGQLLVAVFLGPLMGSIIFGAWWMLRHSPEKKVISDDE
ncbi:MAG: hypothetical protein L0154_22065 [Chloroflexi bacterium]|nr:hypothetical protein [Chloroflexota bacterium]